ncbi:MAG TPA: response regulator transcription factor [Candidatus Aquilonibacter sp.]|nr:response regulator transcription factor [Candidatus Aquilonibacter sp.]
MPFLNNSDIIRVVVADDHPLIRQGVRHLLTSIPGIEVVAEVSTGSEIVATVEQTKPDILVLDITMPGRDGIDVAAELHAALPQVRIIGLTMHEEPSYIRRLFDAGASGYVAKRSVSDELIRAVRTVAAGGTYVDPAIGARLLHQDNHARDLSERERQVLILVAKGFGNTEIATQLELSPRTIETYRQRVAEKLGLQSRSDIVRYAAEHDWLL